MGRNVVIKENIQRFQARIKRIRNKLTLKMIRLVKEDIAIDCGANIGNVTAILARNGATVYAFEPNPVAFAELQSRFSSTPNVHCINKGVYTEESTMRLYMHQNAKDDPLGWSEGGSLVESKINVSSDDYVDIEVIDLDAFITSLGRKLRVLKIDIEGAETEVVPRLIENNTILNVDHVFVETHDDKNPQLRAKTDAIREMVREKGMKHVNLDWT